MEKKKYISVPHYSISQLRVDHWSSLKNKTAELARCHTASANAKKLAEASRKIVKELKDIERFFAYPGIPGLRRLWNALERQEHTYLTHEVAEITRLLVSDDYRGNANLEDFEQTDALEAENGRPKESMGKTYFELLLVEEISEEEESALKNKLHELRHPEDRFSYEIVVQRSFQDAMIALLFNYNIQAVVVRYAPPFHSKHISDLIRPYIRNVLKLDFASKPREDLGPLLGALIKEFRPELDTYYVTDTSLRDLKDSTIKTFRRIFYHREDLQELHLTIMRGIAERYETPFFSALKEYSQKPTGVFHAMPLSRGNSVFKSRWIKDFGDFYGRNLFLAETSATTGGLDSLLQPTGPLKKAQQRARDAYGSRQTFFVTNGTSTANKIVVQALIGPGDIVLIDRDCHKSHHYGLTLAGAYPVYLDSYPIEKYSMYGAVPLEHIKEKLILLKEEGMLDRVKMLLLTNCTFDGIVYNVERVMEEILAIKPDMVFLWDEAWFAFAGFTYIYKQRTAMYSARKLYKRYKSVRYRKRYERQKGQTGGDGPSALPDPDKVHIRVYSTQSTHKTLSSFRQGSMIHIWDEDFRRKNESTFLEAYMTHTSTSPNYQMLASLDVGRRQVQFEGFELVEKSVELAMLLRAKISDHPQLSKYFDVLAASDFIPAKYRESGLSEYYDKDDGWHRMEEAWETDEFVLDPTKITLHIGRSGVDGDTFKNSYLMDKFNIQINKTSRNTVLFMTNIGTTRSSVTYLTNVLLKIADAFDEEFKAFNKKEAEIREARIHSLTNEVPPLPDFSHFHSSFQAISGVPGGNIRTAFFLAYDENNYEYIPLEKCLPAMEEGRTLVASSFIIPYPPGFPVLVPGQVVSREIIQFLSVLDVSEIHGFRPDLGLRVFRESILDGHHKPTDARSKSKKKDKSQKPRSSVH